MLGNPLYARFLRGLAVAPRSEAVRVGAKAITYEAAHQRALSWAGALLANLPAPPRAVGVLAGKSVHAYVGILAALYTGAAVVPLRPDFPVARTSRMLEAAGVSVLVVDERELAMLPELRASGTDIPVLPMGGDSIYTEIYTESWRKIRLGRRHSLDEPRPVVPSDTAYVLFTSGSTGRPKGVLITHGNTDHYFGLLDARYDFTPEDVFSQSFDLNFDCALFDLFSAWGVGASVVSIPPPAYRNLSAFFAEHRMTVWFSTPSSISLVRRLGGLGEGAMPSLRWSLFAGEALRCQDAADWQRAAPASTLENLYGPTELTITITAHRWAGEVSPVSAVNGVVPIGVVHDGHDHMLVDADGSPSGGEGELCVTGPQMAAGYLDPEDNHGRFLSYGGRIWYRTGDRARRLEGGELAYVGRLDSQVQVQGWRIELAEIDHAVRACPGVEDAVTVSASGDGGVELIVFYTGCPASPAKLAYELRKILPQAMIPKHFRHLDELPLNSNRKADRSGLRSRASEMLGGGREGETESECR